MTFWHIHELTLQARCFQVKGLLVRVSVSFVTDSADTNTQCANMLTADSLGK